jgi:hypothetical protein
MQRVNIASGPCKGCFDVITGPIEETGSSVCARCTLAIRTITGAHLCTERDACGRLVFSCPMCKRTSHHPEDARQGYCGACRTWTGASK